ncbi:MAG: NADH-quinone oxidoreductase subunit L [Nitrospirales bacterium]|nr:MAG: NADH-quinone oxidoreductase subunit L [Nitrospirales bacterium]
MLEWLWLIPMFPLLGFLILANVDELARVKVNLIGVGSVGLSLLTVGGVGVGLFQNGNDELMFRQTLWPWIEVSGFSSQIGFYLDGLSFVMIGVITGVGFLIHVYSMGYMDDDGHYQRFFAYMNLFLAAMLILVLADNLLLLFLGWEGVGLCSYLLIGFWYQDPANGQAASKAFIMNRIGDAALLTGLCVFVIQFGTLDIQTLMHEVPQHWAMNSPLAILIAALLLGGAIGKSAQLPLQTWLPDAMAGPTPVSALLHAATMVTAGVYLLARTQVVFHQAPTIQFIVAVIGSLTLLLSAASALVQNNIKRVLAFSTMSQIGYMFLALGVGAASAAIFHFMTHAFFKALLFLAAGAVVTNLHHEQNIFKMGGLRRQLPLAYWTTVIGMASLAGLPFVTAGFFSKEWILWEVWSSSESGMWFWAVGVLGVFLTALYGFRLVFLVFWGEQHTHPTVRGRWSMTIPLMILAILSISGGWIESSIFGKYSFAEIMDAALPLQSGTSVASDHELVIKSVTTMVAIGGIVVAYFLFFRHPHMTTAISESPPMPHVRQFFLTGWMLNRLYQHLFVAPFLRTAQAGKSDIFNKAYDRLFVSPFLHIARWNKDDLFEQMYESLRWFIHRSHTMLRQTQTGHVRWYASIIAAGSITLIALMVYA